MKSQDIDNLENIGMWHSNECIREMVWDIFYSGYIRKGMM